MNKPTKKLLVAFVLGLVVMFVLDMVFHFNNSIETQMKRDANKAQKKIERIFE